MITENLSTLKIHKLTQAQYDRELEAGNIDSNALYLTPDDGNNGVYIQNDEPVDAEEGSLWVDMDADGTNKIEEYIESYVNQQVKKAAPRNLLDNSDFRNPVNQRGQSNYSGAGYGIDRWFGNDANSVVNITGSGILATSSYLVQILEEKHVGDTLTICAKDTTGGIAIATGTVQDATGYVWVCSKTSESGTFVGIMQTDNGVLRANVQSNNGAEIIWAALYEGEYTLDTLPEYQPKGYGAELAECQRYYQKLSSSNYSLGYKVTGDNRIMIPLSIPHMRTIAPTVSGSIDAFSTTGWQGAQVPSSCQRVTTGYIAFLPIVNGFTFNSGSCFIVRGTIELSADL